MELDLKVVVESQPVGCRYGIHVNDLVCVAALTTGKVHGGDPCAAQVVAKEHAVVGMILIAKVSPPKVEDDIGLTGQVYGQDDGRAGVSAVASGVVEKNAVRDRIGVCRTDMYTYLIGGVGHPAGAQDK